MIIRKLPLNLACISLLLLACGLLLQGGYGYISGPSLTVFGPANDRFGDFMNWMQFPDLPNPAFWSVPPLRIFIMNTWKWLGGGISVPYAFCLFLGLMLFLLVYAVYELLDFIPGLWRVLLSLGFVIVSYPVIYDIDRGNIAGYAVASFLLGFQRYRQGKFRQSVLWMAIAINLKLVPALFLLLPFAQKRFRLIIIYGMASALLLVLSVLLMKLCYFPEYGLGTFLTGLDNYYWLYITRDQGFSGSTSLFVMLKALAYAVLPASGHMDAVAVLLSGYNILAAIILLQVALVFYLKKPDMLHGAVIITCIILLLPNVMSVYYLSLLFLPLMLAISEGRPLYAMLAAFAMWPKELAIPGLSETGVILTPLTISLLLGVALWNLCKTPIPAGKV